MLDIQTIVKQYLAQALENLEITHEASVLLEHPNDISHGDFATNIAMVLAKKEGINPRDLAQNICEQIQILDTPEISKVDLAGPGFINIFLNQTFFSLEIKHILENKNQYGSNNKLKGQKILTEFTDPNPFKAFHIGHVMSNTIGESLSRIFKFSGAELKWSNYQGDVGMHVAKAVWGIIQFGGVDDIKKQSLEKQVAFLGKAYAHGATAYKQEQSVQDMQVINKQIYERSNPEINDFYDWGRATSLEYFEAQYKRLGTYHNKDEDKAFHYYFFESEVGDLGKQKVVEYLKQGIFKESKGALIFPGSEYGLHDRVFVNSQGLPTYEGKELALSKFKYEKYPYTQSFVITANEINEYFKVLLKAMSFVFPELAKKTHHIGHGMMKFADGKMSSRTGDVITADQLFSDIKKMVIRKADGKEMSEKLINDISVAAIKFAILRQDTSRDIIFNPEQSVSFEGDSGPYLQYTHARCCSLRDKAHEAGISISPNEPASWQTTSIERYLYRFPHIVDMSLRERTPHRIANYLIELAQLFNSWYNAVKIVDPEDIEAPYKLVLTQATGQIIKNGLYLLGIEAPEKM